MNQASKEGYPNNWVWTCLNGAGADLTAGSPVVELRERTDGISVNLPDAQSAEGPGPQACDLAFFAGVLVQDLADGDQASAKLVTRGVVQANILIPSTGEITAGLVSPVAGSYLAPLGGGGLGGFAPVAYQTGIRLLEDLSAATAGLSLVSEGGGGLVEILPGAVGGPIRHWGWTNPDLLDDDYYIIITGSASAIVTKVAADLTKDVPDYPRNIVITPGGTTADVAAMSITVTGTNAAGETITEDFAFAANATAATTGVKCFASVTGISVPIQDGAAATFSVGTGSKLGLGRMFGQKPAIIQANIDEARESTYPTLVVDVDEDEKNGVTFSTALNGAKDAELWMVCN